MKKWDLATVEGLLEKELRVNTTAIGFDVASYNTGIYVLRTDEKYLYEEASFKIEVPKTKKTTLLEKMQRYEQDLLNIKSQLSLKGYKVAVIEDCFLMGNVWVVKTLARFETVTWMIFKDSVDYCFFKMAKHARNKVGIKTKAKTTKKRKQEIMNWINKMFDLKITDEDLADAMILSLVGLVK